MVNNSPTSTLYELTVEEKKSLFVKGTLMNIKHPRVFEGMLNAIQKYENDEIIVKHTEPFLKGSVLVGDKVKCQILASNYEYTIYSEVSNIDISKTGFVKIKIIRAYRYENLRRDKRYLVNFRTNIFLDTNTKPIYGIVKNISLSGMAIVSNFHFKALSCVSMKFSTHPHKDDFIELSARVIRESSSEGYFEYGLLILKIDDKNKQALSNLINQLENNEISLIDL